MPVEETQLVATYASAGTVGPYPITIPRDRDEDLKLLVDGVASTDFTVDPNDNEFSTGTILPVGTALTLYRETPLTQAQPFPSNTTPAAEDVRAAVDKLTLITQEAAEVSARSVKSPIGETFAVSTTIGMDASGDPIARTPAAEVTHLGIEAEVTAAAASAAAAAASESAASSSESAAAASEAVAVAAEALLETIVGNVFASRTFIFGLVESPALPGVLGKVYVGNTTYNFNSDGSMLSLNVVRRESDAGNPYLFTPSEAAVALAEIINGNFSTYEVELDPSRTLLTGAHTEVTAVADGANLIVSSKLQGTAGNGFTVNTGIATEAGAWVGDTLLGGQDGQLPVLTYNSIPEIPDRLFGIVSGTLYFQLP
tara:strand:+ start:505 stop:1614 length:1110 start_codon:yes stop_codon:yes gene_type:complete